MAVSVEDCDFNQDGKVDFLDFVPFATAYGSAAARYDFNGNGTVDFSDYLKFAGWYGKTVPIPALQVWTTEFPDTLQVGSSADFDVMVNKSGIRGDPIVTNLGFVDPADSVLVKTIGGISDSIEGTMVVTSLRVTAQGGLGSHQFVVTVRNFNRSSADTVRFVVVPTASD